MNICSKLRKNEGELASILDASKPKLFGKIGLMKVSVRKDPNAGRGIESKLPVENIIEHKKYFEINFKRKMNLKEQKWSQS